MNENEERYLWLRNGKTRYRGMAPFVMNPRTSRLYAVSQMLSNELDVAVDQDIFDNKVAELHNDNEVNERGLMPEGASWYDFEGPYVDVLYKLAQSELGWSDERMSTLREDT